MEKQHPPEVPGGYNTVNPFIFSASAGDTLRFIVDVFDGVERKEAMTKDHDGLILHSEVSVGNSTIMIVDRKPGWRFTPAFLQVYVGDIVETLERAQAHGAQVITRPTEFIGVLFSRFQDPWRNIWWVYQQIDHYDWEAAFGESSSGTDTWQPNAEANYIHASFIEAMRNLAKD